MKSTKKVWVAQGIIVFIFAVMAVNVLLTLFTKNWILFGIQFAFLLVAIGVLIFSFRRTKKTIGLHLDAALSTFTFDNTKTAVAFPLPFLVLDENHIITWNNDLFSTQVARNEPVFGEEINTLFPNLEVDEVCEGRGTQTWYGEYAFEIYGERVQKDGLTTYVLFFFENTKYKTIEEEYKMSRPAVMHLVIDNYEEIFQDSKDSEKAKISSEIEDVLERFTADNQGLLKRLNRDRYLIIIEEHRLKEIIDGKFSILDEVHRITATERYNVTLSIGVGSGGDHLSDDDYMAKQAVEMALGRGGDQAAVKTNSGYNFYGGASQGVEKRTKVKTRIIASAMLDIIHQADNCIVMGHRLADLDCFGAAVGMATSIRRMGKDAYIAIDKKQNLVQPLMRELEENGYSDLFLNPQDCMPLIGKKTLLFITDTHVVPMLQSKEIYEMCKNNVIVIDHHRRMVGYIDNALIFFHEPVASSASEMVTELVQYFGNAGKLKELEAQSLLAGITLDTRNFVLKTGVRTFEAAAYLKKQGADTVAVRALFDSTMDEYKERSEIVEQAEIFSNCAVAASPKNTPEMRIVAPQAADELLTISGVDASFILYPSSDKIQISSRSMGKINVQLIMERLGGGGHLTMAGAALENVTLEEAVEQLKVAIREQLADQESSEQKIS